jgi:hypothetical protein
MDAEWQTKGLRGKHPWVADLLPQSHRRLFWAVATGK